ncbi:lipid-A-disaccharide synthase [Gemmatirosa kalamazoonensis]|uniref:Lipid-A-disaccharide synthase n=1 Tax=Gemmatirosa kalamazoonensis TaxID=861299 RepID=W0RJ21_9BACT|nr:lipid-A-disaccharide synthase [Gemmatirosa kalamazoonensis]AHG90761.1 lipid-A-disaccharide synthase [Gemmatirosa kalamazoonensis]
MPNGRREVLFVAGEASGDLHAAGVARELKRLRPELHLAGVGGRHLQAAGVELLEDAERLAVMGFVEVLKHVPAHYALLRRLRARLRGGSVALLVLVDYPGFNMRLAAEARRAGVPVLYFITPQVWAWRKNRLRNMARVITKAAVILPFEEKLLRDHGIDATFVGHPMLDRAQSLPTQSEARAELGLPQDGKVLALFPGSRMQEIERHLDDFVATARRLETEVRGLRVVVSLAPTVRIDPARCPYPMVDSGSLLLLRAATAALCKSGTTTLEAAVAGCPLVVAYRTSRWTYEVARRVVEIPRIGLVNVVAAREVAKEFVQDAVQPEAMAAALKPLLCNAGDQQRMRVQLARVRSMLGRPGADVRVAEIASGMVA